MADTLPIIDAIGAAMKHLGARQQVIAQNIANSDTPGFKAKDIAAPDFAAFLGGDGGGHVTRPVVHVSEGMQRLGARGGSVAMIADTDISETKPDGNTVTLEDQVMKMGQIQADFAALTSLYRKQIGMLKAALGKGGVV
ncbi:flagellar basal body protein [Sphingobium subterraneum]|uniref:Flagellar basal body rod protein FlgB n=1 Tax=Sphingobium subterraneum TaxID=627688 RepID=A0A841IWV1_9SPHN|nr:flagellar basal body protein [Sphingobium subterraneum]MBB6122760.1 flagellar basal-body rod protein FlgB [Sphingobium subterraneum]